MEPLIQSLTWEKIVNLFQKAQERIVIIMPAIHDEWIQAIDDLNQSPDLKL